MQMLHQGSDESGGVAGLGLLPGTVRLIPGDVKRPQMQWNVLDHVEARSSWLLGPPPATPRWVYFVHSYAPEAHPFVVATCEYGSPISAVVERANVAGTQFHPEKSGTIGLGVLGRFVDRCRVPAGVPAERR
jgi:glutamine amidotransferase